MVIREETGMGGLDKPSESASVGGNHVGTPHLTFKLWHDGKAPRLTVAYEDPERIFEGNGWDYLQARKMLSDYFKRHDVPVAIKEQTYMGLEYLAKAHLANSVPSPEQIKENVADKMNELYNTDRILKRGKYAVSGLQPSGSEAKNE